MEVTTWYVILTLAVLVIAVAERFVIYRVLVNQNRVLPEKAVKVANIVSGITIGIGGLLLIGNMLLSKH